MVRHSNQEPRSLLVMTAILGKESLKRNGWISLSTPSLALVPGQGGCFALGSLVVRNNVHVPFDLVMY